MSEQDPIILFWTAPDEALFARAGVCLPCAARMNAQALRQPKAKELKITVCSDACREAVERYHEGAENER
jgi:hypothetical protein